MGCWTTVTAARSRLHGSSGAERSARSRPRIVLNCSARVSLSSLKVVRTDAY